MRIDSRLETFIPEMIRLRRDFHQYPELGFQEFATQKKIMAFLKNIGIPCGKIAQTGVKAVLEGGSDGKTILLRADMDALSITEETGLEFQSANDGIMHACGHDGHMAMLLAAARVLVSLRNRLKGNIVLAFQPNEEDAGAYQMVEEGILKNPTVDAAFGCHLWNSIETGTIDVSDGPVMAASHYFSIEIKGRGGHAGFAHESIDPIHTAAQVIQAVQAIQTRETNALDPAVIIFTKINGGTNTTTVPETVNLSGSIRFLYDGGEELLEKFKRVVTGICQAHRATCRIVFKVGNHLLSNDPNMAALVRQAAVDIFGKKSGVVSKTKTMAGEDFSDFSREVPAAFAFIGAKPAGDKMVFPHHHPGFDFDEKAMTIGAQLYINTAISYLRSS